MMSINPCRPCSSVEFEPYMSVLRHGVEPWRKNSHIYCHVTLLWKSRFPFSPPLLFHLINWTSLWFLRKSLQLVWCCCHATPVWGREYMVSSDLLCKQNLSDLLIDFFISYTFEQLLWQASLFKNKKSLSARLAQPCLYLAESWRSLRMEITQPLWIAVPVLCYLLMKKRVFCLFWTSQEKICCCWLLLYPTKE